MLFLEGLIFEEKSFELTTYKLSVTWKEFRAEIQVWRPKAFRVGTRL
jgi:hypothetical protein